MLSPEERLAEEIALRIGATGHRWMKLREASCYVKISAGRLTRLARLGRVVGFKDNDNGRGDWVFDRNSLDAYRLSQYSPPVIKQRAAEILESLSASRK